MERLGCMRRRLAKKGFRVERENRDRATTEVRESRRAFWGGRKAGKAERDRKVFFL